MLIRFDPVWVCRYTALHLPALPGLLGGNNEDVDQLKGLRPAR